MPSLLGRIPSLKSLFERLVLRLSRRRIIRGIPVAVFYSDAGEDAPAFERLEAALGCIEQYDRRRFRRLTRDLRIIWVHRIPGHLGMFGADLGVCHLDVDYVLKPTTSATLVASTIVHEAAHARLHEVGIRYPEPLRARIERLCRQAELDFAGRLPDGADIHKKVEAWRETPDRYWNTASLQRRKVEATITALRSLNFPAWAISFLRRIVAWRRARSIRKSRVPRLRDTTPSE